MLFPALLLRDFGWLGYAAFAVPNVLGAAAMGFVLKDATAAAALVAKHKPMLKRFSEITISYHVFVIMWLFLRLYGEWFVLLVPPVAAAMFVLTSKGSRRIVFLAMVVSFTAFAIGLQTFFNSGQQELLGKLPSQAPALSTFDLLLFVPASVAGFLCCPYLDLTFQRARMETSPTGGKIAFAVGFGLVFFSMILFASQYGSLVEPFLTSDQLVDQAPAPLLDNSTKHPLHELIPKLAVFFFIQVCFTLCVHLQERLRAGRVDDALYSVVAIALGALLGLGALSDGFVGENIYRGYLLCYGTIFPLYVWLIMIKPFRVAAQTACRKRRCAVFFVASIAAYGFGWLGYIEHVPMGAAVAIAVFPIARLMIEYLPSNDTCTNASA